MALTKPARKPRFKTPVKRDILRISTEVEFNAAESDLSDKLDALLGCARSMRLRQAGQLSEACDELDRKVREVQAAHIGWIESTMERTRSPRAYMGDGPQGSPPAS